MRLAQSLWDFLESMERELRTATLRQENMIGKRLGGQKSAILEKTNGKGKARVLVIYLSFQYYPGSRTGTVPRARPGSGRWSGGSPRASSDI